MAKQYNGLLPRGAERLYQESVIFRAFGGFIVRGRCLFDDRVRALHGRPLSMFFYNQRALFLGCGAVLLLFLGAAVAALPHTREMLLTTVVLAAFWAADAAATLALHGSFVRRLSVLARSPRPDEPNEFPPLFDRYFMLDSLLVLLLVLLGRLLNLSLDAFIFLLFANMVVYGAYMGGAHKVSRLLTALFAAELAAALALLSLGTGVETAGEPRWFYTPLYVVPVVSMLVLTVFSVWMISRLRATEHETTLDRFRLVEDFEAKLAAEAAVKPAGGKAKAGKTPTARRLFERQVQRALKDLCSLPSPFWYRSACLWYAENHKDLGGRLLPGPRYRFDEADAYEDGVDGSGGLLGGDDFVLLHSVKCRLEEGRQKAFNFRSQLDAPAAFLPLRRNGTRFGVLALYGEEGGPSPQRQDREFLNSLRSILSNAVEQWEGRQRAVAERDMDELFKLRNLDEVCRQAAKIMQKYLSADGCMILFRPDPNADEMEVIARVGFGPSVDGENLYSVGAGQTGLCARSGKVIRFDDVARHRDMFDAVSFGEMERAHGKPIRSWMAIPVRTRKTYGVIKVVNRNTGCRWFTDKDEQLGRSLAFRLSNIIEKFLYIQRMEKATDDAESQSAEAQRQSRIAEVNMEEAKKQASQRQTDLMISTHQLQGPLDALSGAISYLQMQSVPQVVLEGLSDMDALVEDALALCYGTSTTSALAAKQKIPFGMENIHAPAEMERLCERLQKNQHRQDLTISHFEEPGFPVVRMDRNVFTSVLYSLVHNAMKYAEINSEVSLVCSFERGTGEAALKVKSWGEPISMTETETIFERFGRGQVHKRTGRHHSGVGLGLWVARELMRAVGGDLTVELSAKYPRLSVFVIHVPNKRPAAAKA